MSQSKKIQKKAPKKLITAIITLSILFIVSISYVLLKDNLSNLEASGKTDDAASADANASDTKDGDLIIPVSDITETAKFYPVEVDGTKLEVLAVKAPDGTIRTAFNTCQVCYSSGRGYYVQEDDDLVCQNCGNRFSMDEVEITKGGCNPVPISSSEKTEDSTNITISIDYLKQAKSIFANWKS